MNITEIPSSKIYDKVNQKILKNKYTGYSFKLGNVKQAVNLGSILYAYESAPNPTKNAAQRKQGSLRGEARHIMNICEIENYWAVGYAGGDAGFVGLTARWCNYGIVFPRLSKYDLTQIQKVYTGVDNNGNPRINISITYKKTTQKVGFKYRPNSASDYNNGVVYDMRNISETTEDVEGAYNIINETNKRPNTSDSATVEIADSNNVKTVSLNYDKTKDNYSCTITIQDYVKYYNASGRYTHRDENQNIIYDEIVMDVYTHVPQKIKITFYGDKLEADSNDVTLEYAINSANVFKLDDNEIMQTNSKIDGVDYKNYVKNSIMNVWGDGLETAELRCSVSDYYDYFTKVKTKSIIDKDKEMLFKNGDVVIPMVATPTGYKPMSQYSDSLPKRFMVMSTGISYDGALWQKLILQEYRQRFRVIADAQYGSKITASNYAPVLGEEVIISVEPSKYYSITKITINGEEKHIQHNDGYNEYQIVCSSDITIVAEAEYVGMQWHNVPILTNRYWTIGDTTYQIVYAEAPNTPTPTTAGEIRTVKTSVALSDINPELAARGIDDSGNTRITAYVDTTSFGSPLTSSKVVKKLLVQNRTIVAGENTNTGTAIATTDNKTVVNSYITADWNWGEFTFTMTVEKGDGTSTTGYGEAIWRIVKIEQFY